MFDWCNGGREFSWCNEGVSICVQENIIWNGSPKKNITSQNYYYFNFPKNCNFSKTSPKQTIIGTNFIEQNRQMFLIYKDFKHWEHIVVLFTQVSVLGFFLFRQVFTIYLYKSFSWLKSICNGQFVILKFYIYIYLSSIYYLFSFVIGCFWPLKGQYFWLWLIIQHC